MEKLQPALRFPEFINNEEIKKYSFNDLFSFSTGKNIKQNEASPEFDLPCVRYGELYHMYNEVIKVVINSTNLPASELVFSEGNEILLPSAGEDPLDIGSASALTLPNVAIGRTINILRPLKKDVYSQLFTSYYINHRLRKKISSLAKGVSISNVYNSDLKTLEILLPTLPEQQKIASFLTTVDDKISNLKQKISLLEKYKKGVMQQIFSQEIRFKDKNGNDYPEWEEKSLGEVVLIQGGFAFKSQLFGKGKNKVLRIGDITNNILNEKFTGVYSVELPNDKYKVSKGDFVIALSGATFGKIGRINDNFEYYINQRVATFRTEQCLNFFFYVMQNHKFIEYIQSIPSTGAQPNISNDDIGRFTFSVPSMEEQTKIAEFLSGIDEKIETTKAQLSKMEAWKKGLLQGMFC
ncbi:MAG: restriction endonuclease subunit S [Bacteroidia bacterium]|nr:restriction endonuclease subunit S [Bacteroidia bacterium]